MALVLLASLAFCGCGHEDVPVADQQSNKMPPANTPAGKGARAFMDKRGGPTRPGADAGAVAAH